MHFSELIFAKKFPGEDPRTIPVTCGALLHPPYNVTMRCGASPHFAPSCPAQKFSSKKKMPKNTNLCLKTRPKFNTNWCQIDVILISNWQLMKMENDGHIESMLVLQATRSEHYCIACNCCRHNFYIFIALDTARTAHSPGLLQAIHQAAAWSVLWSVATATDPCRAQSCLGLNNPLVGSWSEADTTSFASLSLM